VNPFTGLAEYFLGRIQQKVYQAWTRLLFQIAMSMLGSFLFIAGGTMVAAAAKFAPSVALVLGLGSGMMFAAMVLVYFLRRSPLTKDMMFVFPAEEAAREIETNFQTIQK
jgi:uncharacterized transporter YbjL